MKYTTFVLLFTLTTQFQTSPDTLLVPVLEGDFKRCAPLLIFSGLFGYKAYQAYKSGSLDATVLQFLEGAKVWWMTFRCFQKQDFVIDKEFENKLMMANSINESRKECALRHIHNAV